MKPMNKKILRGFQNGEFRRALVSFLKEKCPDRIEANDEVPLNFGLQVIKDFIERKRLESSIQVAGA